MTDSYRSSAKPPRKEVVVATFDTPHEAELARVFLSSRSIEASLKDDTLIGMAELYSPALGGVKLLTDVEDAEEAQKLLDRYRRQATKKRKKRQKQAIDDDTAKRAFRTALIGIFFCPGPIHMYALYMLTDVNRSRLTRSGKRHANAAMILSFGVLAVALVAIFSSC